MPHNIVVLLSSKDGRKLVRRKCEDAGLEIDVLEDLIEAEVEQQGKLRKRSLREDFDEIFDAIEGED